MKRELYNVDRLAYGEIKVRVYAKVDASEIQLDQLYEPFSLIEQMVDGVLDGYDSDDFTYRVVE